MDVVHKRSNGSESRTDGRVSRRGTWHDAVAILALGAVIVGLVALLRGTATEIEYLVGGIDQLCVHDAELARRERDAELRNLVRKAASRNVSIREFETWVGPVRGIDPSNTRSAGEYTHVFTSSGSQRVLFYLTFRDGRLVRFRNGSPIPGAAVTANDRT